MFPFFSHLYYSQLFSYNKNGKITTSSVWETNEQYWVFNEKQTYLYNQFGNETQVITQIYDTSATEWINDYQYINEYNDELKLQFIFKKENKGMIG